MTRCVRRLLRAERLIAELLEAWRDSEHGNVEDILDQMASFMAEV